MSRHGEQPRHPGDEFVRDESGDVVAVSHRADDDEADYWTDERLSELHQLNVAAMALAPSLVGLTVDAARDVVGKHPGLSVLFEHPGFGYPPIGVSGRIAAHVHDGIVVSTDGSPCLSDQCASPTLKTRPRRRLDPC